MLWFYRRYRQLQSELFTSQAVLKPKEGRVILLRLLKLSLPIAATSIMLPVVANLDVLIIPRRLVAGGYLVEEATTLFGYVTGVAVPLVAAASIFTAALAINMVPAIAELKAEQAYGALRQNIRRCLFSTLALTMPCAAVLFILSEKVVTIIYNAPAAADIVRTMSPGIIFLGLHQVTTSILQGLGYTKVPVFNMLAASLVKISLNWYLLPLMGICGASLATVADFALAVILNLIFIYKYSDISSFCNKPYN